MAERYSVLFVDDEPNVLQGLSRMLRKMRNQWDVHFSSGGEEALAVLARENMDVLVTDMRMPGMDGAELLSIVRDRYPHMVRIILSGHSEMASLMRCVKPAHQFLTKPCPAEKLIETVKRACCLGDLLHNEGLRRIVTNIESLPAIPQCYDEITLEMSSENPSLEKIGRIISKDMGMTASLLKLVNSSFFGFARTVTNPAQAVTLLGLDVVRSLVLSVHMWSMLKLEDRSRFSFTRLWEHCMRTASYAKLIALHQGVPPETAELCFVAGLLHDVGKLVLAMQLPDKYLEIIDEVRRSNRSVWVVEREALDTNHGEVGAYLLGLWAAPDQVVEAVAYHHEPSMSANASFSPLSAVHVANSLEHKVVVINPEYAPRHPDWAYLERIGATGDLITWTALVTDERDKEDSTKGGSKHE